MKYIKSYANNSEYEADKTKKYPHVGYIEDTKEVKYVNEKTDYSQDYLTFLALEDGTFRLYGFSETLKYSLDEGATWTELNANTNTPTVKAGNKIMFKGENQPQYYGIGSFRSSGTFEAMGNPYSVVYGDAFTDVTDLTGKNNCIRELFSGCTKLMKADKISLPAKKLSQYCYFGLFAGTSLTAAPKLPATTLASFCYSGMFKRCTSLTTAPALPLETLADNCYREMFAYCTSLTNAPELPARIMKEYCYALMFEGCTALTKTPELPATTLAGHCYESIVSNTDLFPDLTNIDLTDTATVKSGGLAGLFSGTKVTDEYLNTILPKNPETGRYWLPVTDISNGSYCNMFQGCTSLVTAPELPATTIYSDCYSGMFEGCTSLTTAPELPANRLYPRCYYTMFSGCRALSYVKMLASEGIGEYNALYAFLSSTNGGTVAKNPLLAEADLRKYIPSNWTIVDATD